MLVALLVPFLLPVQRTKELRQLREKSRELLQEECFFCICSYYYPMAILSNIKTTCQCKALHVSANAIKNLRLLPTIMYLGNEFVERGLLRRQVHTIYAARLLSRSFRQAKGIPKLQETFLTREEFRNLWCQ